MKNLLLLYCSIFIALCASGRSIDTFTVHFDFNDNRINKQAEEYIDRLIFKDVLIYGQKLIVLGYADYVGDNNYNDKLSAQRAKNVQAYLISAGFAPKDIRICIGKGKIERAGATGNDGYQPDRKVEIIIEKEEHKIPAPQPVMPSPPAKKVSKPTTPAHPTFETASLKVNSTYELALYFKNSSSAMLSTSTPQLEELFDFMNNNPSVRIQIEGHICCNNPNEKENSYDILTGGVVSWARAQAVYSYLVGRGISADRLKYVGLGSSHPLVFPEVTDEDRDKNRRVEIRILSK